jgi:hypothetical protein
LSFICCGDKQKLKKRSSAREQTKVHEMMILSALEYGSVAYGSARQSELKRLEAIQNKGLRIALGDFWIRRTEKILYESGFEDLMERRKRKIIEMVLHVAEEAEHPKTVQLSTCRKTQADKTFFLLELLKRVQQWK